MQPEAGWTVGRLTGDVITIYIPQATIKYASFKSHQSRRPRLRLGNDGDLFLQRSGQMRDGMGLRPEVSILAFQHCHLSSMPRNGDRSIPLHSNIPTKPSGTRSRSVAGGFHHILYLSRFTQTGSTNTSTSKAARGGAELACWSLPIASDR